MFELSKIFDKNNDLKKKNKIAELLQTSPERLEEFENYYQEHSLSDNSDFGGYFDTSSRQMSQEVRSKDLPEEYDEEALTTLIERIVEELVSQTRVLRIGYEQDGWGSFPALPDGMPYVNKDEISVIPNELRPQATGTMAQYDLDPKQPTYAAILELLIKSLEEKNEKKKQNFYNLFRQGLDMLDLDPITYQILGKNKNNMSYWLPAIAYAAKKHGFFKIPKTIIAKVPLSLLQLSRLDYMRMTPTTLKIVDEWAMRVFELDVFKSYFIKNGVFSSKFDFRNAKVTTEKEVRELGEYLLFISTQASAMAHPMNNPVIYGPATTNEWVVREYIEDTENNPTIYKGLPLHTEYRVFVDLDTDEILGISPYWEPNMMKTRFFQGADASSPHQQHDYIIYKMHEETLMKRYEENKDKILEEMAKIFPDVDLEGQWSVDIMQNGNDFWLIDMALADNSALKDCIPAGKLKKSEEDWIPKLGN